VVSMIRAGQLKLTMMRVLQIILGILPGQTVPRFAGAGGSSIHAAIWRGDYLRQPALTSSVSRL